MILDRLANQVMESGMDALWMKMRAHADNIANYSTPDYKAKKVDFHEVLESAAENRPDKMVLRATVSTDENTEARIDGNNVNMEYEQLELWKAQAQYAALTAKINGDYTNLRTVINIFSK
mgnify:CR=1 FL=1